VNAFALLLLAAQLDAMAADALQQATESPVRLVYAAVDDSCPSPETFRTMVKSHIHRDPFGEPAGRIVLVVIESNGDLAVPLRARLEMLDGALTSMGTRTLTASSCAELASTAALQVAIAIEPFALWEPPAAPPPPAVAPEDPAGVEPPPPLLAPAEATEPLEEPTGVAVFVPPLLTLGVSGQLAVAGGLSTAIGSLGGGVVARHDWASARGELRVDIPSDDRPRAAVVLATLAPCAEGSPPGFEGLFIGGCATLTGGTELRLENDATPLPYGGVGLRLTSGIDLGDELLLRAFLQVEGRLLGESASNNGPLHVLLGFQIDGELARW
jgi:hypothetical protein